MTELQGNGEVVPVSTVVEFVGYLTFQPADPNSYPSLYVAAANGTYRPTPPAPAEGWETRPVRVTFDVGSRP